MTTNFSLSHLTSILCILAGLFIIFIVMMPLPDEDAYITFVFVDSLLNGLGLTYFGTKVEGFTNPLWLLILAAFQWTTSVNLTILSLYLSFFCLGCIGLMFYLYLCDRWSLKLFSERLACGCFVLIVLSDPNILLWSLSGMENSFFCLIGLATLLCLHYKHFFLGILTCSLLAIIRSDGIILTGIFALVLSYSYLKENASFGARRLVLLKGVFLIGLSLVPWLAWFVFRIFYYGDYIPNTAYEKFILRETSDRLYEGLVYVVNYLWSSKAFLLLLGLLFLLFRRESKEKLNTNTCMLFVILAFAYLQVIYVGGDVSWKANYRFLTFAHLLLFFIFTSLYWPKTVLRTLTLNLTLILVIHFIISPPTIKTQTYNRSLNFALDLDVGQSLFYLMYGKINYSLDERTQYLRGFLPDDVLSITGKLIQHISEAQDTLLTTAAGKVVYYSGLRTDDISGLAGKKWRSATIQEQNSLLQDNDYLVFLNADSPCLMERATALDNQHQLRAVIYSTSLYSGLLFLIYSKESNLSFPKKIGDVNVFEITKDVGLEIEPYIYLHSPPHDKRKALTFIYDELNRLSLCTDS